MPISEKPIAPNVRAPVTDEELEQWAKVRADDAGHLARELVAYRHALLLTAPDAEQPDGVIPQDIKQAAYDCARGIYLNVDDVGAPYLTEDDIGEIAKYIFVERNRHASPSNAERHERAVPVAWQPKFKQDVIDHHRAQNPDFWEWTITVFQTKEQAENYGHGGHETRPLYAAPPPPGLSDFQGWNSPERTCSQIALKG